MREMFVLIDQKRKAETPFDSAASLKAFLEKELKEYAEIHPFMRDVSFSDYAKYSLTKLEEEREQVYQRLNLIASTTPEEFWEAAYSYDPLKNKTLTSESKLFKLLASERVPPIEIGRVYVHTSLWLIPANDTLPLSDESELVTSYPVARTDSYAFKYPDGHPSIDYEKSGSMFGMSVDPRKVKLKRLYRLFPLGWVAEKLSEERFQRTGHVLVVGKHLLFYPYASLNECEVVNQKTWTVAQIVIPGWF